MGGRFFVSAIERLVFATVNLLNIEVKFFSCANIKDNQSPGIKTGMPINAKLNDEQYAVIYQKALTQLKRTSVNEISELHSLIHIVARTFDCPFALLTVNDDSQEKSPQLFVSSVGIAETSIDSPDSFCRFIYASGELQIAEDACNDTRFQHSEQILKKQLRFCAGCPISLNGSDVIGALCIYDNQVRTFDTAQQESLRQFALVVEGLLRSHLNWLQATIAFDEADQARALSERKEAMFAEVAKVSGVGGWEYEVATNELYWTQQTRDIVGVGPDYKPSMQNGFSFFAPEAREIIEDRVNEALQSNGIWSSELPFITNQGKHIWVKTTGQALFKNGELYRMVGAFQDISERKLLEQKMSENERLMQAQNNELSAIVNNIPQGVAVYDVGGLLKYWNVQHVTLYDQQPGEVYIRAPFGEFIRMRFEHGEIEENPQELLAKMMQHFEKNEPLRTVIRLKSGKIVAALYSQLPDKGWICTSEDITEQEINREKIHYAAHHDTLTGAANRTQFNLYAEEALQNAQLGNRYHMLMLIDLDYFKEVNDTYGHTAGDEVLKAVSQRLHESVRETDLVCRFGGDEFAVLMTGPHRLKQIAEKMAKRIISSVSKPYLAVGKEVTIGVSIGLSWIEPQDSSLSEVLKRADLALYAVKNQGRNGYQFYHPSMDE